MKILRYIKNILIIVCLSFSIISSISKCHAYTFEQFKQFIDACYDENITTNAMTRNDLKYAIDNWYKIENVITQNNLDLTPYTSFAIASNSNRNISTQDVMQVWFFRSISWAGSNNNGGYFQIETPYATTIYIRNTQSEQLKYASQHTWYDNFCCGIFAEKLNLFNTDTLTNTKWDPNDHPIQKVNFEAYNDGNINVFYNGSSDSFLRFNLSRSVNQWALGRLDGLSGDVRVDLKLNRFMNGEFTTSVGHAQWYGGQKTSYGGLSIASDGVVYIKNDGIYYNQGYSLTLDVEGENVDNFSLYFVPYAFSGSSGDLLSPDIDTNSDLEILQNLQDLVNIQNIGAIYENSFASGEIYNTLGYSDYDNIYSEYLKSCFQSLNDTFTLSGDVSVDVSFLGKNLTLRSSNFVVPDGPIKFFCSSFLVFGTIFYFYKQFSHFYHKLQEGDFEAASETFAVDDESLLM